MSIIKRGSSSNRGNINKVHLKIGYLEKSFSEPFCFNSDSEVWLFISLSMLFISSIVIFIFIAEHELADSYFGQMNF